VTFAADTLPVPLMPRILIIGYGNPLKSDDGLGWHAAQELSRELTPPGVKVIRAHQLTPELAEEASRAELVLFIDAREGAPPGDIRCEALHLEDAPSVASVHSHDLRPATILQLARELYGFSPRAFLLTVTGEHFEDGDSLSEPVRSALPQLIAQVKTFILTGLLGAGALSDS
jgi:hydrogenase maturation protease